MHVKAAEVPVPASLADAFNSPFADVEANRNLIVAAEVSDNIKLNVAG